MAERNNNNELMMKRGTRDDRFPVNHFATLWTKREEKRGLVPEENRMSQNSTCWKRLQRMTVSKNSQNQQH